MTSKPVEVVQTLFAAFGKGDLPGMLALLADDVDWAGDKFDADLPTHINRRGKAEVPKFFEAVAKEQDFSRFEPLHFLRDGNEVAAMVREEFTFRRTGHKVDFTAIHHFTIDGSGKISRYRSYYDSARYAAAFRGI
jgi:ketosteroid isomerase-like protein